MDAAPTTMSIAQRIAALNIQTESSSASSQPPPFSKQKSNALASRIAAMEQRNVVSSSTSDDVNNNDEDKSGGDGGQDGGIIKQYKTEKPKVGKLKPLPAGTIIPVIGFGPPPPSQKQREREERMELMKREAKKSSTEVEETMDGDYVVLPTAAEISDNTHDDTTKQDIVGKIKLPAGAVPMMLPITPGLPPIMLKKQREREERMEEMQREAKLAEETEADDATTSPATDENIDDDALLSRPTVTGGKRRPKTRN